MVGGFGRKLDDEQVKLFRDDWVRLVAADRTPSSDESEPPASNYEGDVELVTSLVEIHKEEESWLELALLYHHVGNRDLRDKYIELAISAGVHDSTEIYLRGLQGKANLVKTDVAEQVLDELADGEYWHDRARRLMDMGRPREAVIDYLKSILDSMEEGNAFSAAFYLRELVDADLITQTYLMAFDDAAAEGDLWWQVRVLEDLKWETELHAFVLAHRDEIHKSQDLSEFQREHLKMLLAKATNDRSAFLTAAKNEATAVHAPVSISPEEGEDGEGASIGVDGTNGDSGKRQSG